MTNNEFLACEVCGADKWKVVYQGKVRHGAFGSYSDRKAVVGRCDVCGVERLIESHCSDSSIYVSSEYRELLHQKEDAGSFFVEHDHLQLQNLSVLHPETLRGRTIIDIGCAAGSFLDHVAGLASETIAIEPCEVYHDSLRKRGHRVFSDISSAHAAVSSDVNIACSFSVIEHVDNPREFLANIATLLGENGKLLISTPNRSDVLMKLLPDTYPSFFYRTVHRWYFDMASIEYCAKLAGLKVLESRCVHRFGLSNTLIWLRDRKPAGHDSLPGVSSNLLDSFWQSYLEQSGSGDYLFIWLGRAS